MAGEEGDKCAQDNGIKFIGEEGVKLMRREGGKCKVEGEDKFVGEVIVPREGIFSNTTRHALYGATFSTIVERQ